MSAVNATKIASNLSNGYVNDSTFVISSGSYRNDVYKILPNTIYTVTLGSTVGSFLVCFVSATNPVGADSDISGTVIKTVSNPSPSSTFKIQYRPESDTLYIDSSNVDEDGYLVVDSSSIVGDNLVVNDDDLGSGIDEYYLTLYKDDTGSNVITTSVTYDDGVEEEPSEKPEGQYLFEPNPKRRLLGYRTPKYETIPINVLYDYLAKTVTNLSAIKAITALGDYALTGAPIDEANLKQCRTIGAYAFSGCSNLQTISFPVCTSVGRAAFSECYSLRSVTLPACKSISEWTFYRCNSLETMILPSCAFIGSYAFYDCSALSMVTLPSASYIGSYAFQSCYSLGTVNIPLCETVGDSAFMYCSGLTSIDIPSARSVNYEAFGYCNKLRSVSAPECTYIGSYAFYGCYSLNSLYMPKVRRVEAYAFASCSQLTSISLSSCSYIGNCAFSYCSNLRSISFPEASYVGYSAFYNCSNLETVYLPMMSSPVSAQFNGCNRIETLTLPAISYVSGWGGIANMSSLKTLVLASCRYISYYGVSYCYSLRTVYLPRASYLSGNAFTYCSMLESVYLLSTSLCFLSDGSYAFNGTGINNSSYLGHFGSVFVRASLLDTYKTNYSWSYYSNRLVGLTDAEIEALPWYESSHFA